jgi:hypothetical protein
MALPAPKRARSGAAGLAAALLVLLADPAAAQILPWEVVVAEIEAGTLRPRVQRLIKQFVLYQLHLGEVGKADLVATTKEIDRILESLERGSTSHSIPAVWTAALRERIHRLEGLWGPMRRIAAASPYEYVHVMQEFVPQTSRRADPLALGYFDDMGAEIVAESESLLAAYHEECVKTGLVEICPTARTAGYAEMLIERATKEAIYVVAEIERAESRKRLRETIESYRELRRGIDQSPFFAAALAPGRGVSAQAAAELLASLRHDWDAIEREFAMLAAGDEKNFDLQRLLETQRTLVDKVERFTAAMVRYASVTYGS